jgi:hypothetical protein
MFTGKDFFADIIYFNSYGELRLTAVFDSSTPGAPAATAAVTLSPDAAAETPAGSLPAPAAEAATTAATSLLSFSILPIVLYIAVIIKNSIKMFFSPLSW